MNWITTGDHLLRTIGNGYWPVAGIDLTLLASAALAIVAASRLRRRARSARISTPDFIPDRDDTVLPEADHA
jgi:hypothetical protein